MFWLQMISKNLQTICILFIKIDKGIISPRNLPIGRMSPAPFSISDLILSPIHVPCASVVRDPCPVQSATNVIPAFLFSLSEGEYENMIKYHGPRRILKSKKWIVLQTGGRCCWGPLVPPWSEPPQSERVNKLEKCISSLTSMDGDCINTNYTQREICDENFYWKYQINSIWQQKAISELEMSGIIILKLPFDSFKMRKKHMEW